jgi:hypothetical protein
MTEIVLVHGYGYGSKVVDPLLEQYVFLGFEAFQYLIDQKRALLFDWSFPRELSLKEVSNPVFQYRIYREDLNRAYADSTQRALTNLLEKERPRVVVCHSMGAQVFMEQVKRAILPQTVEHVVFVQADLPRHFRPEDSDFSRRVEEKQIWWYNYYCPWDNALLASTLLNRSLPKGLVGSNYPYIANVFFPLRRGPNFHTSSIRDARLAQEIEGMVMRTGGNNEPNRLQ